MSPPRQLVLGGAGRRPTWAQLAARGPRRQLLVLVLVHVRLRPGPQKRGRAPWLSNSDQASLSSMKIIRACCS